MAGARTCEVGATAEHLDMEPHLRKKKSFFQLRQIFFAVGFMSLARNTMLTF
jgi:hypothetical protein